MGMSSRRWATKLFTGMDILLIPRPGKGSLRNAETRCWLAGFGMPHNAPIIAKSGLLPDAKVCRLRRLRSMPHIKRVSERRRVGASRQLPSTTAITKR